MSSLNQFWTRTICDWSDDSPTSSLIMRKRRQFGVCGEGVGQHLECDVSVKGRISGAIDLSHAALTDESSDVVVGEAGADSQSHRLLGRTLRELYVRVRPRSHV